MGRMIGNCIREQLIRLMISLKLSRVLFLAVPS